MSAYKGHRGVNVSQYVQQLNRLSPPQGLLDEPAPSEEDFSAFLNNDFYDIPIAEFDSSIDLDADLGAPAQQSQQPNLGNTSRKHSLQASGAPNMDFNLNSKYHRCFFRFSHVRVFVRRCAQSGRNGRILFATRRPMAVRQGA
jgi:hypothetical protein